MSRNKRIRNGLAKVLNLRKKPKIEFDDMTEQQQALLGDISKVRKMVDNFKETTVIYQKKFDEVMIAYNCHQFQLIAQDLESILQHISSLETEGPVTAHKDIPLEESEMSVE